MKNMNEALESPKTFLNPEKSELLKTLCAIPGTSGNEGQILDFILDFVNKNQDHWECKPTIWAGDGYQDNLALIFGEPQSAFYAHMDTVGYTVRYDNYLVPIGGPDGKTGDMLVFNQHGKTVSTRLIVEEENGSESCIVDYPRPIEPGTELSYFPIFEAKENWIKSPYLDNRMGVWALLHLAEKAKNNALVFSTYEEHGGGGAGILARLLFEKYQVKKSFIADVTWVSEGVFPGKGPVISLRDSRIPRKKYTDAIQQFLKEKEIAFQLEVEAHGGSDGREIQHLPYPIDWCFFGPPSENPHSALESVHMFDAAEYLKMLEALLDF
jgi:putative aminopeptidase FrvX